MKIRTGTVLAVLCVALATGASLEAQAKKGKGNVGKPLAGYTVLLVEPFVVDKGEHTKGFPPGEEKMLKKHLIAELSAKKVFEEVIEQEPPDASAPPAGAAPAVQKRRLILSGTVLAYSKGSSTARFLMWPIPVAPSVIKVRFVFRDADSGQDIFQTEQQGKYNAIGSLGVADKQESVAASNSGVIRALLKEISKRR